MENNFSQNVFEVVNLIPRGSVTSYGAIANYLGSGKSARMVGWAMNAAHQQLPPVPAHRVVNNQGLLTGKAHFESPTAMEELLIAEGVAIKNNKVAAFTTHFWDPLCEL